VRLLVATTNRDKLREIRGLLGDLQVDLLSLGDLPKVDEPEETGTTFEANARLKVDYYDRHARQALGPDAPLLTVAEDSGLEVDALGGEPGIYSARFVRPDASYPERFAEIYRRLGDAHAPQPWTARFVCAVAVMRAGQVVFETRGVVEGTIAERPAGMGGFGYDPVFYYPPYGSTLGEVTEDEKLRVAHRGVAFRAFARWLSEADPY
jgi:XTP/dITP diphosphohydrolase